MCGATGGGWWGWVGIKTEGWGWRHSKALAYPPVQQIQCLRSRTQRLRSRYSACAADTVPVQQIRCMCNRYSACASEHSTCAADTVLLQRESKREREMNVHKRSLAEMYHTSEHEVCADSTSIDKNTTCLTLLRFMNINWLYADVSSRTLCRA